MLNKPAIIENEKYKFMILCAPDDNSLNYWIEVIHIFRIFFQRKLRQIILYCFNSNLKPIMLQIS
jgi:hypothetical protein